MPELLLELFSEEVPTSAQANAVTELRRRCNDILRPLRPRSVCSWHGPRRIAYAAQVNPQTISEERFFIKARGPRVGGPEQALLGFMRQHGVSFEEVKQADGRYVLREEWKPELAADIIQRQFPLAIAQIPWPKSMRWGQSNNFTWIRPLRRIACVLDGEVLSITIGPVKASNETEGHRFMAPGTFTVRSAEDWQSKLRERWVIVSAEERRQIILQGLRAQSAKQNLSLIEDTALLDEVTGLVEWPVPLLGAIEPRFMVLPPEVRELSMKVNQRYFALRDAAGQPAPFFGFVANIEAEDGGATIIAGNEQVLRARLADAEHFWNQDRAIPLRLYLEKLRKVVFQANLGSQYQRAHRIADLAQLLAKSVATAEAGKAYEAGLLAKADLVTGMVGEFPELQGIMGGYYAADPTVGAAIRTHYLPKGPNDEVPRGVVACAVALADKIDTLAAFFRIGEKPTGSGDPYALRRAALGVLRIILENRLILKLYPILDKANELITKMLVQHGTIDTQVQSNRSGYVISGPIKVGGFGSANPSSQELFSFLIERLRVLLKSQGERYDVLEAVFAIGEDDDIVSLLDKTKAVNEFLGAEDGGNLLIAYRRAANILKIEDAKDGPHEGEIIEALLHDPAERNLNEALRSMEMQIAYEPQQRGYSVLLADLATLRAPVDAFFEAVKINADNPELRENRLRLLAKLRDIMHQIADFSKIEG